jgi:alkaline phosphatase
VLVVDAGGIDEAHHLGNAARALTHTVELSDAVAAAARNAGDDTLIVVTADHGHTLTLGGYPKRGAPILGLAVGAGGAPLLDGRGRPYTSLAYANGPGAVDPSRPPLTDADVAVPTYAQAAATPLSAETHSGEDVPVYARGPGAQWIHGTFEQNVLYWIMHAALGLPADGGSAKPKT